MSERTKSTGGAAVMMFSLGLTWVAFEWDWLDFLIYAVVLYLLAGFVYLITHPAEKH